MTKSVDHPNPNVLRLDPKIIQICPRHQASKYGTVAPYGDTSIQSRLDALTARISFEHRRCHGTSVQESGELSEIRKIAADWVTG